MSAASYPHFFAYLINRTCRLLDQFKILIVLLKVVTKAFSLLNSLLFTELKLGSSFEDGNQTMIKYVDQLKVSKPKLDFTEYRQLLIDEGLKIILFVPENNFKQVSKLFAIENLGDKDIIELSRIFEETPTQMIKWIPTSTIFHYRLASHCKDSIMLCLKIAKEYLEVDQEKVITIAYFAGVNVLQKVISRIRTVDEGALEKVVATLNIDISQYPQFNHLLSKKNYGSLKNLVSQGNHVTKLIEIADENNCVPKLLEIYEELELYPEVRYISEKFKIKCSPKMDIETLKNTLLINNLLEEVDQFGPAESIFNPIDKDEFISMETFGFEESKLHLISSIGVELDKSIKYFLEQKEVVLKFQFNYSLTRWTPFKFSLFCLATPERIGVFDLISMKDTDQFFDFIRALFSAPHISKILHTCFKNLTSNRARLFGIVLTLLTT